MIDRSHHGLFHTLSVVEFMHAFLRSLLLLICLVAPANAQFDDNPAPDLEGDTWLSYFSEKGDMVGQGNTRIFTTETGYFENVSSPSHMYLDYRSTGEEFTAWFSADPGLTVGSYEMAAAKRGTGPGLEFEVFSRPLADDAVGRFDVLEAEYNEDGRATRLAINFEQQREPGEPTLFGKFRYTRPGPLEATSPDFDGPTWISFDSQPGEEIGGGQTKIFEPSNASISGRLAFGEVEFTIFESGSLWTLSFAVPRGESFEPGWYLDATRTPFQEPEDPGLSFAGNGRGFNKSLGNFEILHFELDASGELESFAANFDQRRREGSAALAGKVRFNYVEETCSLGDFDCDGVIGLADIDMLSAAMVAGTQDLQFDLDGNELIDRADHTFLIEEIINTLPGDADLDFAIQFSDFLALSHNFGRDGGWEDGDFDGNLRVDFADFLLLSNNFGKTSPTTGSTMASAGDNASVPEPSGFALLLVGGLFLVGRNRNAKSRSE